jgi:uncharacterized protein
MRRQLLIALAWMVAAALIPQPANAADPHRLALQVSDNDADKMNAALNVSHYYSSKGQEVEIQVIAFNAGLNMLREDTSPVKPRLKSFAESMPNVSFMACQNTLDNMTKREGKKPDVVPNATMVPSGAVTLIELSEKGWTIIRP